MPRILINRCGTQLCEPSWSWDPAGSYMADYDLWFVWAGRGTLRLGRQEFPLFPGNIFCLPPGSTPHATHDPVRRLGVCYFHFDILSSAGRPLRHGPPPAPLHCILGDVPFHESLLRRAVDFAHAPAPAARQQAASLLHAVLCAMRTRAAAPSESPRRRIQSDALAAVMRDVRQDPAACPSVAGLAARCGYSVDHFTRVFRAHARQSPKQFLIHARLARAQQLLAETPLSIDAVSRTLAYPDVFTFSRQFKTHLGQSPSRWRTHSAQEKGRKR